MAHTTNIEYVLQRVIDGNYRCYKITDGADRKIVLDQDTTGNLTPDLCQNRLRAALENLNGLVYVQLSQKSSAETGSGGDTKTGQIIIPITLGTPSAPVQGIGNVNAINSMAGIGELMAAKERENELKIEALRKEFLHQNEVAELKRKLEEDKPNPLLEKAMFALLPMITGQNQPPAMAGADEPKPVQKIDGETAHRVNIALTILRECDPDGWLQSIETLAKLAKENPQMYEMAKQFTKN